MILTLTGNLNPQTTQKASEWSVTTVEKKDTQLADALSNSKVRRPGKEHRGEVKVSTVGHIWHMVRRIPGLDMVRRMLDLDMEKRMPDLDID
jgi:hypothetical protein